MTRKITMNEALKLLETETMRAMREREQLIDIIESVRLFLRDRLTSAEPSDLWVSRLFMMIEKAITDLHPKPAAPWIAYTGALVDTMCRPCDDQPVEILWPNGLSRVYERADMIAWGNLRTDGSIKWRSPQ